MASKIMKIIRPVLILIVVIGIIGAVWWPRAVQASFPQIDGEIILPGLDARVDVYRDAAGIPHIYASTEHDLFMAQGYVHAQDRFWQMDMNRHAGSGRLAELIGKNGLSTDRFLRTMGWLRISQEELKQIEPEPLAILNDYSEGVNAYLVEHSGTDLALEYAFINILNPGYQPKPWSPINTLTWAKAMAWDLKANMETEIIRSRYLLMLTPEQVADIFPPYPEDRPVIVGNQSGFTAFDDSPEEIAYAAAVAPAMAQIAQQFADLDDLLGGELDDGVGSNSWAI